VKTAGTTFIPAAGGAVRASLAALLLTTVHHLYGAYVYGTPWRAHVAFVSIVAAAALVGSYLVLRERPASLSGEIALAVLAVVAFALPVAGIGVFEGGYNHVLKNALYFGGASLETVRRLFPPPAYELPDDVFFEVTGILQLPLGLATAVGLYQTLVARWRERRETGASAQTA
jgi:hypothetical protein